MTRFEALKQIGSIYDININKYQLKNVGQIFKVRNENETINKIFNIYDFLMYNLYQNNVRLKDVTKIHLIKDNIFYDLKELPNCELCVKEV